MFNGMEDLEIFRRIVLFICLIVNVQIKKVPKPI